jgi:hypothetical protein
VSALSNVCFVPLADVEHLATLPSSTGSLGPKHALDYPGHGFSDIPKTDYDPNLFVRTVEGFLEKLDLRSAA